MSRLITLLVAIKIRVVDRRVEMLVQMCVYVWWLFGYDSESVMFMAFLCVSTDVRRIPFFSIRFFVQSHPSTSWFLFFVHHTREFDPHLCFSLSLFPVDDKNLLFLFFSTCFVLVLVCYTFFYLSNRCMNELICFFVRKGKRSFAINHAEEIKAESLFLFWYLRTIWKLI
jgi:hypothetical protein